MSLLTAEARADAIATIRARLERRGSPRLHMTALILATSVAGLVASWGMLHGGLTSMALRYPLAAGIAYLVFLGLVGLWLRRYRLRQRQRDDRRFDLDVDIVEVPIGDLWQSSASTPEWGGFGRGGGFSGGGSSGPFGDVEEAVPTVPLRIASALPPRGGGPGGSTSNWDLALDEDALWLLAVGAVIVLVLSVAAYVVYSAPVLFAELLLDAGLAAGLVRRLSAGEPRAWLRTAVRATIMPMVIAAMLLGLAGYALMRAAPGAASIGPAIEQLSTDGPARAGRTT